MKYTLAILGAYLAYRLGKEAAWEEIREAMAAGGNGHAIVDELHSHGGNGHDG